jgi:hypothetical protein
VFPVSGLDDWIEPLRRVFPIPRRPDLNTPRGRGIVAFRLGVGVLAVPTLLWGLAARNSFDLQPEFTALAVIATAPAAGIALFLLFRFPTMGVMRVASLFCFLLFNVIPAAFLLFVYGMVGISSYGWRG